MGDLRLTVIVASLVALPSLAACTRRHGPHITLSSPSMPSPSFGDDAPRAAPGGRGGGGGGGAGGPAEAQTHARRSEAETAAVVAGIVAGSTALATTVATGGVTCKPDDDSSSRADAGASMNLCSGERRPAAPDVERAFRPLGGP